MKGYIKIKSVTLVPTPEGYVLDVWPLVHGVETELKRFTFENVQQVADFSADTRRVALMATGFEELHVTAEDVQEDDLFPFLQGGKVYTIDTETKRVDEAGDSQPGMPVKIVHFALAGSSAIISIPADETVTVLRKIA